jgi:hypothetical protein
MVRDGYSVGGQPQQADGGAAQPLDIRSSTASLTQELSQLLAASIAQGHHAGKRATGNGGAVGSELANLAALVSASQGHRSQQPSFKDGLSSLAYARPAHHPAPPPPPVSVSAAPQSVPSHTVPTHAIPGHSASGLLVAEPHDEEPMPIPSTWRQPTVGDDERWYRQQLGAAGLGLVAGLIVVVPAVLWLSGWLGGAQTKATVARYQTAPEQPAPVKVAEVKQVKVHVAASTEPSVSPSPTPSEQAPPPRTRSLAEPPPPPVQQPLVVAAPKPPEPVRSRADELMAQGKRLIDAGDILRARTLLEAPEAETSGPMAFMLAETFDPNMLASWQTRGIMANPERARALYKRAQDLGETRAQQRLDWLTGN